MSRKSVIAVIILAFGTLATAHAQEPAQTSTAARPVPSIMRLPDEKQPPMISLAPAVVVLKASFGQTVSETLTLSNETPNDYAFDMVAQDVVIRDSKRVFVPAGELPNSIAQSAVFSQPGGTVKPHSSTNVTVRFTIPATTDIRAVVALFRGKAGRPTGQTTIAMTASLGGLITFTLTDAIAVEPGPAKITVDPDGSAVTITSSLRNTGKEPVVPTGVAAILDPRGRLVGKASFTSQRLLPGEKADFRTEYAGQLTPASYKVLCSFDMGGKQITSSGAFKVE